MKNTNLKTADEMFEEHGYRKVNGLNGYFYYKTDYGSAVIIDEKTGAYICELINRNGDRWPNFIEQDLHNAIHQKIKEINNESKRDG